MTEYSFGGNSPIIKGNFDPKTQQSCHYFSKAPAKLEKLSSMNAFGMIPHRRFLVTFPVLAQSARHLTNDREVVSSSLQAAHTGPNIPKL